MFVLFIDLVVKLGIIVIYVSVNVNNSKILVIESYFIIFVDEWKLIRRVIKIMSIIEIILEIKEVKIWFYNIEEWLIGIEWNCWNNFFCIFVNNCIVV